MARKGYSGEDILNLLRQIELELAAGSNVQSACRKVGVSDASYYIWRKKFGGMGRSAEVLEALYPLFLKYGKPEFIRSDNGKEFTAQALQIWLTKAGIKPMQITPGSPWENRYSERFDGTLRRKVLNAE